MPSSVGTLNITVVQISAVVGFGDAVQLTPTNSAKTYAGSGSFLTGGIVTSNSMLNSTFTNDPDIVDNKSAGNQTGPGSGGTG